MHTQHTGGSSFVYLDECSLACWVLIMYCARGSLLSLGRTLRAVVAFVVGLLACLFVCLFLCQFTFVTEAWYFQIDGRSHLVNKMHCKGLNILQSRVVGVGVRTKPEPINANKSEERTPKKKGGFNLYSVPLFSLCAQVLFFFLARNSTRAYRIADQKLRCE